MPERLNLWQRTLAPQGPDIYASARDRLRASYESCRDFSSILAAEIHRDLPSYTVHDITHIDALWELANLIAGPDFQITPLEAYVLGCATLIHDLAMGSAAYPAGVASAVGPERWRDTVYFYLQRELGRPPTAAELASPSAAASGAAQSDLLRELHAYQAARLPHEEYRDHQDDTTYYLISDPDIRNMFGDIIGRLAASHWWDLAEVSQEFDALLGAPSPFPAEWTVDPLKIACLLRVADASHLDSRRAPGLLRAVRNIDPSSRPYWIFQERLNRPWLDGDRLTYTAQQPFTSADSQAWWLCVDALRTVDKELRDTDTALADSGRHRFAARSVAYVDDLQRLARLIPVRDWFPIDASIQVSDVIDLVKKIGGKELYGEDYRVPLRELISNAADAIRARRALDAGGSQELRLRVQVELRSSGTRPTIIVRDNGLGMSREVMTGPLLDFGKSFWRSSDARRQFPGLISSGFTPTGQFGIGFFSVFMLGDCVRVASRRFDLGAEDTNVLIFENGLGMRPLLRRARPDELLPYGGTEVAVELDSDAADDVFGDQRDIVQICEELCPTADFNLDVVAEGQSQRVIEADDWLNCPPEALLSRLRQDYGETDPDLPKRLRPLISGIGKHHGRAAILRDGIFPPVGSQSGLVTADGMRTETRLSHIGGVFIGQIERAARDVGTPTADKETLAEWATEQARIIQDLKISRDQQFHFARIVRALGGDPGDLYVALSKDGPLHSASIVEWASGFDIVYLLHDAFSLGKIAQKRLEPNVLVVSMGIPGIVQLGMSRRHRVASAHLEDRFIWMDNSIDRWCARKVSEGWATPFSILEQQMNDQIIASNVYSKQHGPNDSPSEDPDFPYRVIVATSKSGEPIHSSVRIIKRI